MKIFWIQNADLSVAHQGNVKSSEQVMSMFEEHDWSKQFDLQAKLERNEEPCCPAGLGIVKGGHQIFHLIPMVDGSLSGYWHDRFHFKRFGFLSSTKNATASFEGFSMDNASNFISLYIRGQEQGLARDLGTFPSGASS